MLFLYPATFMLALSKLFLLCVVTTHDVSTYVGIAAVDAGLRIAHIATYATLSRSGLQLPVGAFLPAPEAPGAADMVLYAAPAAIATWRSSTDIFERVSGFAMGLKAVVSQAVAAIRQQWDHHRDILTRTQPVVLLASERAYYLGEAQWIHYNQSSTTTPTSIYASSDHRALIPLFPSVPSPGNSDMCPLPVLGVCAIGYDAPDPVATRRLIDALLDELEGPYSLIVYEPPPHSDHFALGPHIPRPYIIIHVPACLIGLLVACLALYTIFLSIRFALRLILRLARSVYSLACVLFVSSCRMARDFLGTTLGLLADIWGKLWQLVLEAHIFCATRTKILPVAPRVEVNKPAQVKGRREKNDKRKKKANKGSTAIRPSFPPPAPASAAIMKSTPNSPISMSSSSQTAAVGELVEDKGGEWTAVTRARKARRASSPVLGGRSKSGSRGGRGRD